ncbi:MAG TPA: hemolysin family protein [Gaiellaceae bacterium]|nr:hemolysin family protein [Gaiellaceae bacterium]
MSDSLRIVVILLLVLGNAVFVAAEYSLVTARRGRLEELAKRGNRRARTALGLLDEPVRFISTVQVGITVFGILLGALGEPLLSDWFGDWVSRGVAFLLSFLILTYLSVVLGELVPKSIALQRAERLAVWLAVPLDWLGRLSYPLVWVLQRSANGIARLFGVRPAPAGMTMHTEEDIRLIVAQTEEIQQAEEEMLYKVFDFADKEAHDVMVPRPEVVALSVELPPQEALAAVIDSPYTRYPVYRGSLDDVIGILHVRDLFGALYDQGIENVVIEQIVRPAYVVPETKDLASLLAEFRRQNQHMALVVDEYGAVQGIVTLEDLLEEIVGEIEDEYDLPDESVERIDDRRIRVHGTFTIDDFNEQFGTELPQEDYHTVAGFVFGELGRAPQPGDEVEYDGLRFEVVEVDGQRIERLEIQFVERELEDEEAPEEAASAEK